MGVWEPNASGSGGKWRAEILSEDQEGTNPKEIERCVWGDQVCEGLLADDKLPRVTA